MKVDHEIHERHENVLVYVRSGIVRELLELWGMGG